MTMMMMIRNAVGISHDMLTSGDDHDNDDDDDEDEYDDDEADNDDEADLTMMRT